MRVKTGGLLLAILLVVLTAIAACGGGGGGSAAGSSVHSGKSFATGTVTLSWDAPTTNTDGTPLTDLAGYKIYYGTTPGNYTTALDVGNVTTFVVNNLTNGLTYYFSVSSYNSARVESSFSNVVSKTLTSPPSTVTSFVITASADIGGTITPYGTTGVNSGANQTFTIAPNAGYNVATVLVDGVSQGAVTTYTFTSVTANHTIRATFAQNNITAGNNYDTSTAPFVITASVDIGGTITPYGTTGVNDGANQTFTITPNAGYDVATVLVDGVSQGAVTTYTFTGVTANHTIRATFAQNPTAGNNYDTSTFETSDDGWAWYALAGSAASFAGKTNVYAHTGNYSYQVDGAADYPDTGPWYDTFMVKTLNLRPGTMTFWARSETGTDHVKVTIGNTTVLDWTAVGTSWAQQSITVTQTGPLEVRIYSEYSADPSVPLVDDIVIPVW